MPTSRNKWASKEPKHHPDKPQRGDSRGRPLTSLLIAFTNGQRGSTNPARQCLKAALLGRLPPLNILKEVPEPTSQFDYSPLWNVHFETWTDAAVANGQNLRQTDFSAALQQVTDGLATGGDPAGFVVNCPVVSLDVNPSG